MSKLTEIAGQLERNASNISAPKMLRKLDENYILRRYGVKREKKQELDADGNPVKNTYFPHLAITATCYARTWKMLKDAQAIWGCENATPGDVWEHRCLLALEHVIRYMKHDIAEPAMLAAIQRLVNPLPKSEYLKRNNKKNQEVK